MRSRRKGVGKLFGPGTSDRGPRALHPGVVRAAASGRRRDGRASRLRPGDAPSGGARAGAASESRSSVATAERRGPRARGASPRGRGPGAHRTPARAGQAHRARARRPALRSGCALPRDRAPRRVRPVRRAGAGRRRHHWRRHRAWPRGRRRRQRRDGQSRIVVARDDPQDPARAGNRHALPRPDRVPRRLGGREPAVSGRRVSRASTAPRGSSTTTPSCGATCASRRSRRSWGSASPAAHICPRCRT